MKPQQTPSYVDDVARLRAENQALRRRIHTTERRERERQGERRERLERALAADGRAIFDWMDTAYDEVLLAPEAYAVLGYEAYMFLPSWTALEASVHPVDRPGFRRAVRRAIFERTAFTTEIRIRRAVGEYHYVEFAAIASAVDGAPGHTRLTGTLRDIEAQHRRRGDVAQLQEQLSLVLASARGGMWDWPDMSCDEVYWSPELHRLMGFSPERFTLTTDIFWGLIHEADVPRVRAAIDECRAGRDSFDAVYRLRFRERGYRRVRSTGTVRRDRHGAAHRLTGAIFDIHDRPSAAEHLAAVD